MANPLPDAPQCVIVRLSGTINNGRWSNTHHLQYTGTAPTVTDLNSLCNSIATAWGTNFAPMCPAVVSLTAISAADLTNRAAAQTSVSLTAIPGTRAGTANPNQVCAVVSWPINHRYRGGHPRTYVPAGVQADLTNGAFWTTAFHTALLAAATAFRTAVNAIVTGGTSYKMITLSYVFNKLPLNPPVPYTIGVPVVHGRVDTQRLRLGKETP